jgi:uncharacterized RDD family membrane protein YckC
MPREFVVTTPENVEITHSLAGIGSRCIALILDHLLQGAAFFAFLFLLALAVGGMDEWAGIWNDTLNLSGWAWAAMIVFGFLVFWGYFILFETIWNGQTPGKRFVKIRVVKDDGRPIDFFASAIRNVVRILDMMPGVYAVGFFTMFISPAWKRVGDYAAGTLVVKEYREGAPKRMRTGRLSRADLIEERPSPPVIEPTGEEEAAIPGVTIDAIFMVTKDEYETARRYLERRGDLSESVSDTLARKIAEPILSRLEMTPEAPERYPYGLFLERLARDYIRRLDAKY